MQIKYSPPTFFYPKQQQIYDCPKQFTVVMSSNKTGKTLSMGCWINEQALLDSDGGEYAWISPFSETSKIGFQVVCTIIRNTGIYKYLKNTKSEKQFRFNSSSPQKITYPNGSTILFIQGGNVGGIYGHKYKAAVVDEASRLKDIPNEQGELECPAWEALLSCMVTTQGQVKLISNPTTKNNWYNVWYNKVKAGKDKRAEAFHLNSLDSIAAGFVQKEDFDYAKEMKSKAEFSRVWLGEIPDEDSEVFMSDKVYACVNEDINENIAKVAFFGIDLGYTDNNKSDWTVVTGMNTKGQVVFFKRFKAEGEALINKLKAYINNRPAFIDATGGGYVIYTLLAPHCKNLEPYKFSHGTKCTAIETLAHYIHTGQISYGNNEIIIQELLGYECEVNSNGLSIYNNGKKTQHDDSVISLALAVLKYKQSTDLGDQPTGEVFTIDIDEDEGDWQPMQESFEFDYGIY